MASDKEQEFKHPSYGMVQLSRRTGNPTLFGSALDNHFGYVTLSIRRATLVRDEHGDRYHGSLRGDVVEVDLSGAQFAELLTTMNVGMGVPCTISLLNNQRVEPPPARPVEAKHIQDDFEKNLREFAKGLAGKSKEVREILEKKNLNKEDRAQIQSVITDVIRELTDNAPFVITMFREATEKIVTAAKTEADAWLTTVIHQAGLKSIQEGQALLELPGKSEHPGKVRDPDCNCYKDCHADSQSGNWHQHEDEPCPVHDTAPMVG
jgi:hypothetical protein